MHDPMPGSTSGLDKLEIGRLLVERFVGPAALDFPPGEPEKAATRWLEALGFERVEWLDNHHDISVVFLWYTRDGKVQEFGLEFFGDSPMVVSVLDVTVSAEV